MAVSPGSSAGGSTRRTSVTSRSRGRPSSASASTTCTSASSPTRRTRARRRPPPTGSRWRRSRSPSSRRPSSWRSTATTVEALEAGGYDDPIFLIGADELAAFPTWKQPERVLQLARLGVATRPGYAPTTTSPRIQVFELEPHPVSSSEIRERVRSGEPLDGLVAPAVAQYIAEHGLYVRVSRLH